MTGTTHADKPDVDAALEKRRARVEEAEGIRYVRYHDDAGDAPRGTIVHGDSVVWGYPRIGRIVTLRTGLREQLEAPFWAEEKINGFNVRIAKVGGKVLAFSRGGFVCPFTTDRLADLLDLSTFEADPALVVCGEVAGPESPYLESGPPFVEEDVRLFVFDLMQQGRRHFLDPPEKVDRLRRYGLPATEIFGRFAETDLGTLRAIVAKLHREQREGIVLKEEGGRRRRAKYVTGSANIADIADGARQFADLPPEYFTDRVLRLAMFLDEEGLDASRTLKERLGGAFLEELSTALHQYRHNRQVGRRYRCRFRRYDRAAAFIERLRQRKGKGIQVVHRRLEKEGDFWVLEFDRVSTRMNGLLGHSLAGGLVFD